MTLVADQGELTFTRQIYNSFKLDSMDAEAFQVRRIFAESQMAALGVCFRSNRLDLARDLWNDLTRTEATAGPNLTAALSYSSMLFTNGHPNEAVVVLAHYSKFFMERHFASHQDHDKRTILREAFEWTILNLSSNNLLTPSIGLDVSGFSLQYCGVLGPVASRHVLGLFDHTRLMGLAPAQLTLTLQLLTAAMEAEIFPEDGPL